MGGGGGLGKGEGSELLKQEAPRAFVLSFSLTFDLPI